MDSADENETNDPKLDNTTSNLKRKKQLDISKGCKILGNELGIDTGGRLLFIDDNIAVRYDDENKIPKCVYEVISKKLIERPVVSKKHSLRLDKWNFEDPKDVTRKLFNSIGEFGLVRDHLACAANHRGIPEAKYNTY